MELVKFGYAIDYKLDCNKNMGVREKFNFLYKGDDLIVNAFFGLDNRGNILIPAFESKINGYTPLTQYDKDVLTFCRSNKSLFSVVNSLLILADCKIVFDKNTKEIKDCRIILYTPVGVDNKNNKLILHMVSDKHMLNTVNIPQALVNSYTNTVKNFFNYSDCQSKSNYIKARLKREE